MPRPRRFFDPGVSLHVIHRGNNRMTVFNDDADFELFLMYLQRATNRFAVDVHAFVLMSNHYHLIVTPSDPKGLAASMKLANGSYVQYFNKKHGRIGTLWNGRFRAIGLHDRVYWLTCLRYIELNPVAAQIVTSPEAYPWSSYSVHAFGSTATWLAPHANYTTLDASAAARQSKYRDMCRSLLSPSELALQKCTVRR